VGTQSVGIVGGGIVGLAVARELTRRRPGVRVVVLEKEAALARHQTGHNSGVVHAGIYYAPGSLKARLCTRGRDLLREHCAEHGLPFVECGKVVVAVRDEEMGRFDDLERRASANEVPGLRRLSPAELREIEPNAVGLAALHSPRTAITDFVGVAESFGREVEAAGGSVLLSHAVTGVRRSHGLVDVVAGGELHRFDELVVCAGLQSDRVGRLADGRADPRIVPFRGEYLRVRPERQDVVRGLVYPVPDPRYPFLGVHWTRRVDGSLDVGPNAVLALAREGYGWGSVSVRDVADLAWSAGTWRMARAHWRTGIRELRGSLSVRAYMALAQEYVPSVGVDDVVRGGAGVRAQAVARDGSLLDDFHLVSEDGITVVRNAPSPAATSSLAIAEHVVDQMGR
jgi:L-2-hydroxyglutarate oxidase LhgO